MEILQESCLEELHPPTTSEERRRARKVKKRATGAKRTDRHTAISSSVRGQGKTGSVLSDDFVSSSDYGNQTSAKERKQVKRDCLTAAQIQAVRKHSQRHIDRHEVPRKSNCEQFLKVEPLLAGKSWSKVKCTVRNEIERKKREIIKLQK